MAAIKLNILKVDWVEDKVALITDMPMSQEQVMCLAEEGGEYPSVIRGAGGAAQRCVWRMCNLITSIVQSLFHHCSIMPPPRELIYV